MQSIILKNLSQIVEDEKIKGSNLLYIRSRLKEYLQVYLLNFIYTHPIYSKQFIFTGGTCLRHCFELNRLSEDVDFDLLDPIDTTKFVEDLKSYWLNKFGEKNILISVRQQGRQILQKFSVLRDLGLSGDQESPVLYVKTDLSPVASKFYSIETTLRSLYGFTYLVSHYDLESLMSSKIHAVLFRQRLEGSENIEAVKGRDFYDLIWFMQKKVNFNAERFEDLIGKKVSQSEVWEMIDKRVDWVMCKKAQFSRDLIPFIDNQAIVETFVDTFKNQYLRLKSDLL